MARSHFLSFGLILAVCSGVPAQSDEPTPQPTSTLLVRLKSKRIALDEAQAIGAELQFRPTRGRLRASKLLRDHYLRYEEAYGKLAAQTFANFEQLTKTAQSDLLGKTGNAEAAKLRAESLSVTRKRGLSKNDIKREVDPRIAKLRALLQPTLPQVLAADKNIGSALATVRTAHHQLREWYILYASATAGLELHEDATKHWAKYPLPNGPGSADRIDEAIQFALFAGLPMKPGDRKALDANASVRVRTPPEEYLGTLELNRTRYLLGLGLLRIDEKLSDAARDHSKDMHTMGFFSHTSTVAGKQRISQRARNFGTSAGAENIAAGQRHGHGAIKAWWYSPGHHRNMLGNHRRTGLGQHATTWTQMFGG